MLENPFECECGAGDYGETVDSDISLHQEQYLIYNIKQLTENFGDIENIYKMSFYIINYYT